MFARMRGGGGGRGYGRGSSSSSSSPQGGSSNQTSSGASVSSFDSIREKWEQREADHRAGQTWWENAAEDIRDVFGGFHDPLSMDDYYTLSAAMPGVGMVLPTGAKAVGAAGKMSPALKSLLKALGISGGALAGEQGIAAYREKNPTMSPTLERLLAKGEDLLGTVSALAGLAALKRAIGIVAPQTLEVISSKLGKAGTAIQDFFTKPIAGTPELPKAIKLPLSLIKKGYEAVAGFTGNELSALKDLSKIPGHVNEANVLKALSKIYGDKAMKVAASDPARSKWLLGEAAKWTGEAGKQMSEVWKSLRAAGYVVGGIAAVEGFEQGQIDSYKKAMKIAYGKGEDFVLAGDPDPVQGPLSAAANFALGTLGNPIEKQTRNYYGGRYSRDLADIADYEVRYDRISEQEKQGYLSREQAQKARDDLAKNKPWNMAGRSLYSFTPAAAGFIKYQAGNLGEYFSRPTEVDTVTRVLDGDTIQTKSGKTIRFMGVDTPESVHPDKLPEYMGPEASKWQKKELTGKTVKIVRSPGSEKDKYGRDLAYVETLPGPLDKVLKLPLVGKYIPAVDQNKKTIEAGYGQPRYLELSGGHARQKDYDLATTRAIAQSVGVHSAEGKEKLEYHYQPKYTNSPSLLDQAGTYAGIGLMGTGQSGTFRALGPTGNAAAQTWNALMSAIGTAQHVQSGNKNQSGRVYRAPKDYATDYQMEVERVLNERKKRK